ncbi:MAG: hypothetical protein J6R59_10775 [Paludibacteraceae bacterium]|nr:hypothetical protein [Paludibacteraceae bacterium]
MPKTTKAKFTCFYCGNEYVETNFYKSYSDFYSNIGKIPYCKQCVEKFYQQYFDRYTNEGCLTPEKKAVQRLCMIFDIYYKDDIFISAMNKIKTSGMNISPMFQYIKQIQLQQYKNKSYENTISEAEQESFAMASISDLSSEITVDQKTIDFFGSGFTDEDYKYLKKEYDDWTARHECNTKAQEEVIKDICFNRLQNLKALRKGEDTKDITASFQKMLDAGKLQPKQNAGDTTADNQTFGTLIDKWENERPLPEIDEELKDVDKIGFYIDTFFKGHTCRMLNVKNAFSNLYSSMMKKFTVNKPEYNLDEDDYDSEINFDAIFGDQSSDLFDK